MVLQRLSELRNKKRSPVVNLFLGSCVYGVSSSRPVMMQIKFNSLFYKLADAAARRSESKKVSGAPGAVAGQPCSEVSASRL